MRIFGYILIWGGVWIIALVIKIFLGELLESVVMAKAIKSLIMAIPTGVCVGLGVALHNKLKKHFKR